MPVALEGLSVYLRADGWGSAYAEASAMASDKQVSQVQRRIILSKAPMLISVSPVPHYTGVESQLCVEPAFRA